METLRCVQLNKVFNGVRALEDVSLDLSSDRVTAIIGPNGAGKTTLLNIFTGFLKPEAGRCLLGEKDITHLAPYQIALLGIRRTFQEMRLVKRFSALDNVILARPRQRGERLLGALVGRGVGREERRNIEEAMSFLHLVGLGGSADQGAGELSYGQQKLLTIACCLAAEATILLLDEPVAGVHPDLASGILRLIQTVRAQGKLVVFVEHDMFAVRQVADRVVVMDGGRVISQGEPGEVLDSEQVREAYLG